MFLKNCSTGKKHYFSSNSSKGFSAVEQFYAFKLKVYFTCVICAPNLGGTWPIVIFLYALDYKSIYLLKER